MNNKDVPPKREASVAPVRETGADGPPLRSSADAPPPRKSGIAVAATRSGKRISQVAAVCCLALLILLGVLLPVFLDGGLPGSIDDHEPEGWRDSAAYASQIRERRKALMNSLVEGTPFEPEGKPIGWRESRVKLPNLDAVRAALERRLPLGWELQKIKVLDRSYSEDSVEVHYAVILEALDDWVAVRVRPFSEIASSDNEVAKRSRWLISDSQLPAGMMFEQVPSDDRVPEIRSGQKVVVPWTVEDARVSEGKWIVRRASPLGIEDERCSVAEWQQVAADQEMILISRTRLEQSQAAVQVALAELMARLEAINKAADAAKEQALSSLPSKPVRSTQKFGGSGSGEPTKTGTRIVGGAASGAAIGALAGGGEGAGWGALGGAILGGVYDAVSKSSDRKKMEQKQAADYQRRIKQYEAARRAALKGGEVVRENMLSELDAELKQAAAAHDACL